MTLNNFKVKTNKVSFKIPKVHVRCHRGQSDKSSFFPLGYYSRCATQKLHLQTKVSKNYKLQGIQIPCVSMGKNHDLKL